MTSFIETHERTGHQTVTAFANGVTAAWTVMLPLQMQSVLLLASRGPDGIEKFHSVKHVTRAYRGTILRAASRRRFLYIGEAADDFMTLDRFGDLDLWRETIREFFRNVDNVASHYVDHLAHGAEILAYKHPLPGFRMRWMMFYEVYADSKHLNPETEAQLDNRLNDFGEFSPNAVNAE